MILCVCLIVLILILDQVSKALVAASLAPAGSFPLIENVLHFTYVENRGAAFGMLQNHRWVFMVFSVIGIAAMVIWLVKAKPQSRWERVAVAFIVGGGIANMIDRVRLEYVIDFIDCRFIDFYVFNVADSFVCIGCGMFMAYVIWEEFRESREKKAAVEGGADLPEENPETKPENQPGEDSDTVPAAKPDTADENPETAEEKTKTADENPETAEEKPETAPEENSHE